MRGTFIQFMKIVGEIVLFMCGLVAAYVALTYLQSVQDAVRVKAFLYTYSQLWG